MGVVSSTVRRHGSIYMADPFYRMAWLVGPLALALFLTSRLLLPAENPRPPEGKIAASVDPLVIPDQLASIPALYKRAYAADSVAETMLRQKANEGSATAQSYMGNLYDPNLNKQKASESRTREAIEWYRKGALQGLPIAETNLGVLLAGTYFGITPDYEEARRWLEKVAPISAAASRELALLYRAGHGVPFDQGKANGLLKAAAERGDVIAEDLTGLSYESGTGGLKQNSSEAVRMFRLAAWRNDPFGERKLAMHFEKGDGLPVDRGEAERWYARAAAGGDRIAQTKMMQIDPAAEFRSPKWGATPVEIRTKGGSDVQAEREACIAARATGSPEGFIANLPASFEEQKKSSEAMLKSYPRDPRVRYARAADLYDKDRSDLAKVELECAVDDPATWYRQPDIEPYVLALLARIDSEQGDGVAARATVATVCASKDAGIRRLDQDIGFCRDEPALTRP